MDDLSGLLVEGFGLRPRDRAPMAASKARGPSRPPASAPTPPPPKPPNLRPSWSSPVPDYSLGDLDLVFGGSAGARSSPVLDDDLFGGFPRGGRSSGATSLSGDDIFGSLTSAAPNFAGPSSASAGGDLLGDFGGGSGEKVKDSVADPAGGRAEGLDELISGFGGSSPPRASEVYHKKSSGYGNLSANMSRDPFIDLESTVSASHSSGSFSNKFEGLDILSGSVKSDNPSTAIFDDNGIFNEFQGSESLFASGVINERSSAEDSKISMHSTGLHGFDGSSVIDLMFAETKLENKTRLESDPLLDLLTKPSYATKPTDANKVHSAPTKPDQQERSSMKHVESAEDIWFSVSEASTFKQSSGPSSNIRKTASSPNILDDWNSLFGAPSAGEFQEIEGEPEERRRARLERHRRTLERAAKALDEKNERDIQMERENAEKHRISERLDVNIRRWAAGKEGNLRALLSSLQDILWPECGWQPVTLTDLITSSSVKKVYRKATLCVHPDKVQQKGATLQQKYIAEKVFDLLKEAWKKLNAEELS